MWTSLTMACALLGAAPVEPAKAAPDAVAPRGAEAPAAAAPDATVPPPTADPECRSARMGCVDGRSPTAWEAAARTVTTPPPGADAACLERLRRAHIRFRILADVPGVPTPVEITDASLGLVRYLRARRNRRRFILDCHTAEALAALGRHLRRAGVAAIYWSSAWRYTWKRGTRELSAHASGRALDVTAMEGSFGFTTVAGHYERGVGGCGEKSRTKRGAALRRAICVLHHARAFRTLYTPDTDADHRDHLHLEDPHPELEHRIRRPAAAGARRALLLRIAATGGLVAVLAGVFLVIWSSRRRRRRGTGEGAAPPETPPAP